MLGVQSNCNKMTTTNFTISKHFKDNFYKIDFSKEILISGLQTKNLESFTQQNPIVENLHQIFGWTCRTIICLISWFLFSFYKPDFFLMHMLSINPQFISIYVDTNKHMLRYVDIKVSVKMYILVSEYVYSCLHFEIGMCLCRDCEYI